MFRVGEKIRCINLDCCHGPDVEENPEEYPALGSVYTVDALHEDMVMLEELEDSSWSDSQFELARPTNEERIRRRMEEINE